MVQLYNEAMDSHALTILRQTYGYQEFRDIMKTGDDSYRGVGYTSNTAFAPPASTPAWHPKSRRRSSAS